MNGECKKKDRPHDCINCEDRESFVANKYCVEIECKYGKKYYQANPNYLLYEVMEGK